MVRPYNDENYNVFGNYFRSPDGDIESFNYSFNVKFKQNNNFAFAGVFSSNSGRGITGGDNEFWSWRTCGYTTVPTTSQLYFKVANAVQNLELLDAGEVMESLADKIGRQDCKAYVTETYQNGSSWYRVYSDGWCEQGGAVESISASPSITFLRPFKNDYFSLLISQSGSAQPAMGFANRNRNGFLWTTNSVDRGAIWQASGYII